MNHARKTANDHFGKIAKYLES